MSKYRLAILLVALLIPLSMFVDDLIKDRKETSAYFQSLDLVLSGVVQSIDRPPSSNDFGILKVSILKSNRSFYDPRKERKFYYCLIKKTYVNNGIL